MGHRLSFILGITALLFVNCEEPTIDGDDEPTMTGRWTWTLYDGRVGLDVLLTQSGSHFFGSGQYYVCSDSCTVAGNNNYPTDPNVTLNIFCSQMTFVWEGTFITRDSIRISQTVSLIRQKSLNP